jgi:hypothetical protein
VCVFFLYIRKFAETRCPLPPWKMKEEGRRNSSCRILELVMGNNSVRWVSRRTHTQVATDWWLELDQCSCNFNLAAEHSTWESGRSQRGGQDAGTQQELTD